MQKQKQKSSSPKQKSREMNLSSDEQVADETNSNGDESMPLSLNSETRWSLLNSIPAFLLSLLNLDTEDSKLIPEGEFGLGWFQSDFPSPSFRSSFNFEVKLAGFVAIQDADRDGPLFWPLEHEIEWKSMEDWDWFAISPRKKDLMELKQRREMKANVPRIGAVPSRFNRGKRCDEKIIAVDRDFVEKDWATREEIPIETLLGLREFDGHEGLGSAFDEVVLSLDEDETWNRLASL